MLLIMQMFTASAIRCTRALTSSSLLSDLTISSMLSEDGTRQRDRRLAPGAEPARSAMTETFGYLSTSALMSDG